MRCLVLGCVVLALCLVGVFGTPRTDFEDGTTDSWYLFDNDYYSFSNVDGGAASTAKAGRLVGGAGLTRDGPLFMFAPITPTSISFYVKAGVVGNVGGVAIGRGNDTADSAIEFTFLETGQMGLLTNANRPFATRAYEVDRWYAIRFQFAWDYYTFSYYVDDVLMQSGISFKNAYYVREVSTFHFFNPSTNDTQISYIDQVFIGCPNNCNNQPCDAVGTCACTAGYCGADCTKASTTLTRDTVPILRTNSIGDFYTFYPNGVGFTVSVKSTSQYRIYYKTFDTAMCASENGLSGFTQSAYANAAGILTYSVSQCDMYRFYNLYTNWSLAIVPDAGSMSYSIQVNNDVSVLGNNRKAQASGSIARSVFTFKVPETVNPTNTLTFTMDTENYAYWYGGNYTNECTPDYSGKVMSGSSLIYTYTVTDAIPGDTWSWFVEVYAQKSITAVLVDCDRTCSNGGVCLNNMCSCPVGFTGENCENRECPSNCNYRGTCDGATGNCTCDTGFAGAACQCIAPMLTTTINGTSPAYSTFNNYFTVNGASYPLGYDISSSNNPTIYMYYGTQCGTSTSTYINGGYILSFDACDIQNRPNLIIAPVAYTYTVFSYNLTLTPRVLPALVNLQPLTVASAVAGKRYYTFDATGGANTLLSFTVNFGSAHTLNSIYIGKEACINPLNPATYVTGSSSAADLTVIVDTPETTRYYVYVNSFYSTTLTISVSNSNCGKTCSGRGICLDDVCQCAKNYAGDNCETFYDCSLLSHCSNQGTCGEGNQCYCDPGYAGQDCGCSISRTLVHGDTMELLSSTAQTRAQVNTSGYPDGAVVTIRAPQNSNNFFIATSSSAVGCPSSLGYTATGNTVAATGSFRLTPTCSTGSNPSGSNPIVSIYPSASATGTYSVSITPFDARLGLNTYKQVSMVAGTSHYWIYDHKDANGFIIYATATSCEYITANFAVRFGECATVSNSTQRMPYLYCASSVGATAGSAAWGFKKVPLGKYYIAWNAPSIANFNATLILRSYSNVSGASNVVPSLYVVLLPLLCMLYYLF